jgi:hypothetical protein
MLLTNKQVHTKDKIIVIPLLECDERVMLVYIIINLAKNYTLKNE